MSVTRPANSRAATAQATEPPADSSLLDRVVDATRSTPVRDLEAVSRKVAKSGLFNRMTEDQVFTLCLLAEAEGLHFAQALRRFHVIKGQPSMRADAMQAEFQRHGGRLEWIKATDEECEADFWHPALHPKKERVRHTVKDLFDKGVAAAFDDEKQEWVLKDNYRRHPRAMLRARVISEGVRAIDPGVVVGIYTPEEVSDFDQPPPAPRRFDPEPEPERQPAVSPRASEPAPQTGTDTPARFRDPCLNWIQSQVDEVESRWAIECAAAKRAHNPLLAKGAGAVWQVIHGVVAMWLEREVIQPGQVSTPKGDADRGKRKEMILAEWADEEARQDLMIDIGEYLRGKFDEGQGVHGINLDAEPVESAAN